jgi:hypothetical protein
MDAAPRAPDPAQVEVVLAHQERVTVRVGDVFLKIDADDERLRTEVAALTTVSVPCPPLLWCRPHVVALQAIAGEPLALLGSPSAFGAGAWQAAGAVARLIHAMAPPAWARPSVEPELDRESAWLVDRGLASVDVDDRMTAFAAAAMRPFEPAFVHGDYQAAHVFVEGDVVTGVIDWSDAGLGDPLADLAVLTNGHSEWLPAVVEGYGRDVDRDAVVGWWAIRKLRSVRWMLEHGFDARDDIAGLHRFAADGPS